MPGKLSKNYKSVNDIMTSMDSATSANELEAIMGDCIKVHDHTDDKRVKRDMRLIIIDGILRKVMLESADEK